MQEYARVVDGVVQELTYSPTLYDVSNPELLGEEFLASRGWLKVIREPLSQGKMLVGTVIDGNTITYTTDWLPINQLKSDKVDRINALRTSQLKQLTVEYNAFVFDSDPTSISNVTAVVTSFSAGILPEQATISWRDANNIDHALGKQDFYSLAGAMLAAVSATYSVSWVKKVEVEALLTPEEVVNYIV